MKIKKLLGSLVAGTAMLAIAGMASANDINIYGASAQFSYWQAAMPYFLANQGCLGIQYSASSDGNHMIVQATCGGNLVNVRYSNKASYDGIAAVKGNNGSAFLPVGASVQCNAVNDPLSANPAYDRKMLDEAICTFNAWTTDVNGNTTSTPGACGTTATKCVQVTMAASDVKASSFLQKSMGAVNGPAGNPSGQANLTYAQRNFNAATLSTAGLTSMNPFVVPFGFFVNKSVQQEIPYSSGNWSTISNISRLMAVSIFSGGVTSWKDFGDDYRVWDGAAVVAGNPLNVCLRHAGSGSHATLDAAVIKGNGWGGTLLTMQSVGTGGARSIYFNDGTGNEMDCINGGDFSANPGGTNGGINWSGYGAIGYADADRANKANTVGPLNYQGFAPSRVNIRNGRYDFWTLQWLYWDATNPDYLANIALIGNMENFIDTPANMNLVTSKAAYYATKPEMKVTKATADFSYPSRQTATNPQLP